jgi:predicted MPP superfamily phosphohydrolase
MILRLILLLATVLGLLVGGHYLLYHSAVRAFAIEPGTLRKILLALAFFLSASFPLAILFVKIGRNPLSSGFFVLAALWMGLFINLLMAAGAGWLVAGVFKIAGLRLDPRWVFLGAGALALLFTAWGVWKARHPQVRRIEVAIDGLPEAWRGRTIVHLSDLHLGHTNGVGFMRDVARRVNALDPDLIVITGDLFDGMGGDFSACIPEIDSLKAKHGVFFSSGNHEVYSQAGPVVSKTRLRVLDSEVVEVEGLQIAGVAYPGLSGEADLERFRRALSKDKPSILLFHTPTDIMQRGEGEAARHFSTYWTPDTACRLNRELGVDLQLSGHSHAGQIFPFGLLSRLLYHGRDRGLHTDGSFHLFVSSGTGTFGPPMRTSASSEIVVITLNTNADSTGE